MNKLEIKDLHVEAEGKKIINGITFTFETSKTYALIGPNGNGKSTLLSAIMGDPNYTITSGSIVLDGMDITHAEVDERARMGLYIGMQYPPEIAGIKNIDLITASLTAKNSKPASSFSTFVDAENQAKKLRMDSEMINRDVNVGFSGGEKKKNEILHMAMLKPKFALLDEIDSGLDVDSIEAISNEIKNMKDESNAFIIISHYKKLYSIINPDVTIVIRDGRISEVGSKELLNKTLDLGFDR